MSHFDDSDVPERVWGLLTEEIQKKFLKGRNQSEGKMDKRLVSNLLSQIYLWAYLTAKIKDITNSKNL